MSVFHFRVGCVSVFQLRVGGEDAGDVAMQGLLSTEAQYVSAEGDVVVTSLGALDGDRAVQGLPVRRIRSSAGQRHYPGLFWSATTMGHVWYESRLELDRLWLADFEPAVEWIASQPVWLCGRDGTVRRRHAPDLLLKRRGGAFVMVDVKPEKFASLPKVAAVFDWTSRMCAAKGWRYEVWSGAPATLLANVRWLGGGRRPDLIDPAILEAVRSVGLSGMTIGEVCAAASAQVSELLVKPAITSLLWSGEWLTDLQAPVSDSSVVSWAQDAA